tara:strand:+ start:36203 stop:38311 length:2109 start_codon:yes stop_codon:yes gene_type:complete
MNEKKDIYWRAYLIYFGFVILMLVVFIKTISIQFGGGSKVYSSSIESSEKMPTRITKRMPRRGQILDANYTPLVTSVSFYDIHIDPWVIKEKLFNAEISNLCAELAQLFPEKTAREYEVYIKKGRKAKKRYLLLRKKASNIERKKLHEMPIFKEGRFKGGLIDNEETIIRKRPHGELMKRTLGYVRERNGKTSRVGIEGAFDPFLKGEEGEQVEQKISTGWKKIGPITKEAIEGASVITTIDKEIQEVAHSELLRQLKNQDAKNGCVIVMDVKTGYVKAIVNLKRDSHGDYHEAYNQAIGIKEVPGSTFKLASLMALLEDGKVKLSDIVNAKGVYKFYDAKLEDSHSGGYGMITIQQAFEKSSNVFSQVVNDAYKREPQTYVNRLKSFGLADSLGISLKGEPIPTLYEPGMKSWSGISLPWMAIGYEVQQTPLQTLAFYNAVANNGTLVRPQFVKEIIRENEVIETYPPQIIKDKICSEKTIDDLKICLEGVVKRGTGSALKSAFFDIAGKTGTALVLNDDRQYGASGEKKYQASFCGYFPAQDPIYSCIVVVSAPNKDIYGATVSGTVFTAIANKVYASSLEYHKAVNANADIKKKLPISKDGNRSDILSIYRILDIPFTSSTDSEWIKTDSRGSKVKTSKINIKKEVVPDVSGMVAKDAIFILENAGMIVKIKGFGRVTRQSIAPNTLIEYGKAIEIILE